MVHPGGPNTAGRVTYPWCTAHIAASTIRLLPPCSHWSSGWSTDLHRPLAGHCRRRDQRRDRPHCPPRGGDAGPPSFAGQREGGARARAVAGGSSPAPSCSSLGYSEGLVITCIAFGLLALLRRQWWLAGLPRPGGPAPPTSAHRPGLRGQLRVVRSGGGSDAGGTGARADRRPALAPLGFVGFMAWLWGPTPAGLSTWRLAERGGWKELSLRSVSPSTSSPTLRHRPGGPHPDRSTAAARDGSGRHRGGVRLPASATTSTRPPLRPGRGRPWRQFSAPVGLRPPLLVAGPSPLIVAIGNPGLQGPGLPVDRGRLGLLFSSSCLSHPWLSTAVFPVRVESRLEPVAPLVHETLEPVAEPNTVPGAVRLEPGLAGRDRVRPRFSGRHGRRGPAPRWSPPLFVLGGHRRAGRGSWLVEQPGSLVMQATGFGAALAAGGRPPGGGPPTSASFFNHRLCRLQSSGPPRVLIHGKNPFTPCVHGRRRQTVAHASRDSGPTRSTADTSPMSSYPAGSFLLPGSGHGTRFPSRGSPIGWTSGAVAGDRRAAVRDGARLAAVACRP